MVKSATVPAMLRALRLPAMLGSWEKFQDEAIEHNWGFSEYLAKLCEQELTQRDSRRLARYLQESKLPISKKLNNFDFNACPNLRQPVLAQLANDAGWVEHAENLLLFGASGVGKSHLAAAIGHGLLENGKRVLFTSATAIVQKLQAAKRELKLPTTLSKLDKYDLLILDDIGYVKSSEVESSVLFQLIAHRYETGSILITSNHAFSDWDSIFADSIMAVAAIDRLIHHATIIKIEAQSYRKTSSRLGRSNMPE